MAGYNGPAAEEEEELKNDTGFKVSDDSDSQISVSEKYGLHNRPRINPS